MEEARARLSLEELKRRVVEQRVNVRGGAAFPLVNFPSRILASAPSVAVLAEVKRASPSKGDIAPGTLARLRTRATSHVQRLLFAEVSVQR